MRVTALVLLGVATASLAVLAWSQVLEAPEAAVMGDVEVVWCDANRPLVALAAETLGLLPGDLTNRNVNLQGDDPEDDSVDLTGLSALSALRRFRSVAQDVPPDLFADIGFPTEQEFECSWSASSRSRDSDRRRVARAIGWRMGSPRCFAGLSVRGGRVPLIRD